MGNKPLKIIGKKVVPVSVKAKPVLPIVKFKKPIKTIRAQNAINDILTNGTPVSTAMLKAGYSPASSNALLITRTDQYKDAMTVHVSLLTTHRDEVLKRMTEIMPEATYPQLTMSLDILTKQIQLLTGKATGRIGFDLPDDERSKIIDIIAINSNPINDFIRE